MTRVKMKVKVLNTFEQGLLLKGDDGEIYSWFTKSYSSPLFYSVSGEWFSISATKFVFDHPTPRNGLKNVRVLKKRG
jgi:hypothetical protein